MRYDVVIIGGGLAGMTAGLELQQRGLRTLVVSEGLSLHETPRKAYTEAGGTLLSGDSVIGGDIRDGVLLSVRTRNLGDSLLEADHFILATGKYYSGGLVSTADRIYEPVFGCDVSFLPDRSGWCVRDFFARQPFEDFGVRVDADFRVSVGGETVRNLYAAGDILEGEVDIVKTALEVCIRIR